MAVPLFPQVLGGCTPLPENHRVLRVRAEREWVGATIAAQAALQGCCHRHHPLQELVVAGGDAQCPNSTILLDVASQSTNVTPGTPAESWAPWGPGVRFHPRGQIFACSSSSSSTGSVSEASSYTDTSCS